MTALTADRLVLQKEGRFRCLPVAAGAIIHAGSIVAVNAGGLAVVASAAPGLTAVGRANQPARNATTTDGAVSVLVERGVFAYANATGADALTRAAIGATCYLVDDQTVAATNGTNSRSPAGRVFDVDGDGVWVEFF